MGGCIPVTLKHASPMSAGAVLTYWVGNIHLWVVMQTIASYGGEREGERETLKRNEDERQEQTLPDLDDVSVSSSLVLD